MALDVPVPTTPTYCTAADIAAIRREASYTNMEDRGRPSLAQVNTMLLRIEDEIDRTTKHAWRSRKVTNEFRDLEGIADVYGFIPVDLRHRAIIALDAAQGDKVEVRSGSTYEDYLQTRAQGVGGDFWIQDDLGILYVKRRFYAISKDAIRISYHYGEAAVPGAIARAAALLCAAELEATTVRANTGTGDLYTTQARADRWRAEAHAILGEFTELVGV